VTEPRSALAELTLARLRLFFREPGALFWTFGFPLMLAVALGIAFRNRPPEPVRVAVVAQDGAAPIAAALSPHAVQATVEDAEAARKDLRVGKVVLVVVPGQPLVYRYDETRPEGRAARLLVDGILQKAAGRIDPAPTQDERVAEVGARYIDFLIPGLIGLTLMSSSLWGIGYVIVDVRTRKLLKRMIATPMRRSDFLLSFVIMRAVFILIEVPVLIGFGCLVFGMRLVGSPAALLLVSFVGAMAFAGIGLLVSSRAQNTQTVGGLINLVMLPMSIGSGVFFATSNFPDTLQPVLRALPLTVLNDGLRAIVNEGAGVGDSARVLLVLAAWAGFSFAGAVKLFRWR
jgi:ABC-type polysaccharide/polyol phosphate export permease